MIPSVVGFHYFWHIGVVNVGFIYDFFYETVKGPTQNETKLPYL
jgi:hypothetical protein